MSMKDESKWLQRHDADWQLSLVADRRGRASGSADDSKLRCKEADAAEEHCTWPSNPACTRRQGGGSAACRALAGKLVLAAL